MGFPMSFIFWLWAHHVQVWIYYRIRSLHVIFSWHVTASVGRCVSFQTWEMKLAAKHLSWVGLHLLLMRSFIYKIIWQETSCRDVSFTDGNIHSLLSFRMMDTLNTIYVCVCIYIYTYILSRFRGHAKSKNSSEILMKILVIENVFRLV